MSTEGSWTSYRLTYYAPHYTPATDREIRRLLGEIELRWSVGCDVTEVPARTAGDPSTRVADEATARKLYDRDFRPRAAVLRRRTRESISLLRSRSGHYYVAGTVAITTHGQVEWVASYATPFADYDRDPTIAFLMALLQKGRRLLEQLTPPITKGAPELGVLDTFIASFDRGGAHA